MVKLQNKKFYENMPREVLLKILQKENCQIYQYLDQIVLENKKTNGYITFQLENNAVKEVKGVSNE